MRTTGMKFRKGGVLRLRAFIQDRGAHPAPWKIDTERVLRRELDGGSSPTSFATGEHGSPSLLPLGLLRLTSNTISVCPLNLLSIPHST